MITQVYHLGNEKWIEITNIDLVNSVSANSVHVQLYSDKTGDQTGKTPDVTFTVTSELSPGQSVVFRNTANTIENINSTAISIDNNSLTNIDGGNDIITLSTTTNATSWTNRYDVISEFSNNTSYVRIDETLVPNTTYTASEWVAFIDDALDPYRLLEAGGAERHPHDPLISEIESSNTEANTQLGLHRINITTRKDNDWDNGFPDRSRFVVIDQDYNHNTVDTRLSARKLTVNASNKLSVTDNLLVVTNDVLLNGDIRLVNPSMNGAAQLIQTHTDASLVTGTGRILVDINSETPSLYRYNYIGSPVIATASATDYTVADIFKDGTTATNHTGIIGTDIAKDINWVSGYDGDTTDPISLADYWIYTYAASAGTRSTWTQKFSTGSIPNTDGFIFKGPGRAQNYTFLGIPKDGLLKTTVAKDESYLVGNPYASAISVKKFIEDNETSITGVLYFWQHASEESSTEGTSTGHNFAGYIGGYATRTIDVGVAANNYSLNDSNGTTGVGEGLLYDTPGLYIPIGQGFFIEGDDTDGGDILFNNSQREFIKEATDVSVFFKGESTSSKNKEDSEGVVPVIKLGMDYLNEDEISLHRQIGISFNEFNSFNYDKGYDAGIYDVGNTDFYWKFPSDETKYVISGVQEISSDLEVPLEITMGYSGAITIMLDEIKNITGDVYIVDKTTGISYEVTNNNASLTLDKGVYTDRFVLAFKPSTTLSIDDLIDNEYTNVYADNKNHQLVISKNLEVDITNVELYNILGEKVSLWTIKEQNDSYQLDIKKQIPTGVYIVRLNTNKGKINKKIVIE